MLQLQFRSRVSIPGFDPSLCMTQTSSIYTASLAKSPVDAARYASSGEISSLRAGYYEDHRAVQRLGPQFQRQATAGVAVGVSGAGARRISGTL